MSEAQKHSKRFGRGAAAILVLTVIFVLSAGAPNPARAATDPILSAAEIDYPPFCIVGAGGQAGGFSVELLRAALAATDRRVSFRTGTWTQVRGWLESGQVQALPLVARTPERETLFDFTVPYMTLYGAIVVRADSADIRTLEDLRGRTVAVMKGDNAEEFLRRRERGIDIHTTATFQEALGQLSEGRCDAVVIQRLVALRLIQETGLTNLKVVPRPIEDFRQDFCFAVREGDRDTLALLNEGLALVMADGTYRHLHAKWFAALELPTHRRIVVGGDHNYPPYEYLDENGRPTGYNVELTRAIAREMDLDVEIRLMPWPQVVNGLKNGDIDILQGMFYSPQRDLQFDFTPPHNVHQCVSVVRQGVDFAPTTIGELIGRRIVVEHGDLMHEFAVENGLGAAVTAVGTQEDALRELVEGKHDCALVSRLTALYWIEAHGWDNLTVARRPLLSPKYGYAVPNGHKAMLATFSEGLKTLESSGEYQRIYEKWLGIYAAPTPKIGFIVRGLGVGIAILLVILLAMSAWTRILRRQVAKKTVELHQVAAKFRDVFEAANAGKSITLPTGEINVNQAFADFLGYSPEELEGKSWQDLTPAEDIAKIQQHLARLLDGEQDATRFEKRYIRKDGTWVWGDVSTTLRRNAQDRPLYFLTTIVDISARKEAEEMQHRLQARLAQAVEIAHLGYWEYDAAQDRFIFDDAFYRIYKTTAEEVGGYTMTPQAYADRFVHPDDRHIVVEETCNALKSDDHSYNRRMEHRIRYADGTVGWISVRFYIVKDEHGKTVKTYGVNQDITERKEADKALQETEKRFRTIFEKSPYPMTLTEVATGRMIEVNDEFCKKVGIEKKQLVGRTTTELGFYSPASRAKFVEQFEKHGKVEGFEMPFRTPEQSYLTRMHADLITIANTPYLLTSFEDITARRQSEDALRESEQRLHAILESGANPTVVYNAEGFPQYLNPAFTSIFGWTREELAGQLIPFVPDDQKAATAAMIEEIYATGEPVKFATQRLTQDGRRLDVIVSAAIIKTAEGKSTGMVVSLTDVSEQKSLELQLNQAQKMESVGRLAGGVAHDFNNMLGVILGYGEMAQAKVDRNDPLHDDLGEIIAAARRSADITRQLLAFARRQTIAPKVLDLNDTVEGMLRMLRRIIGEDIDLQWLPQGSLWPVKIDPGQVDQLLANLCVNARDAIDGTGKITIETDNVNFDRQYCRDHLGFITGDYVLLAVSDDGSGMGAEIREHLFEPFFTTKDAGQGTGLGLATVYGIVKQNNGFINVYSEPGAGTTFKIYLPRHAEAIAPLPVALQEKIDAGHGETILVVEDEAAVLKLSCAILEGLGYRVMAATGPAEAEKIAGKHDGPIDLLITDVVMPQMNGRELATRLQTLSPNLRVLYMSGYTANVIAHHGVLEGGVYFIQKPFSRQEFAARVREALG
ncbi:MAG: transporter substrate-binding domain-containing protein [Desulfobacterales bacterium]|jgi:PAS domain S-box-containing protein|nr:transporter substrate-binding domain-containing protein [Desulfobacterales bacterium]